MAHLKHSYQSYLVFYIIQTLSSIFYHARPDTVETSRNKCINFQCEGSNALRIQQPKQSIEERITRVESDNLNIACEQMRLCSINALELREAQRNSVDAEFRLIQAAYEAKMAETDLLRLSGGVLE